MQSAVVVPCYNEAQRLDLDRFSELARRDDLRLLFVDDGSTDDTGRLLSELGELPGTRVVSFPRNRGKAEAVRRGMQTAIEDGAPVVAYYDADLASPPAELLRLLKIVRTDPDVDVAIAARVALLGRTIERSPARHYTGRIFATVASAILRLPVYDTQCGLKVFRVTPSLSRALDEPFTSRWAFDVELIHRLIPPRGATPVEHIIEIPLREWHDIPGSKLGRWARIKAGLELLRYGMTHRRPRRS